MAATVIGDVFQWGPLQRDEQGHRTYTVVHRVKTASVDEGPASALQAAGLPSVGSYWNFGSDVDIYAYCTPIASVSSVQEGDGERSQYYLVSQQFTTKPMSRCNTTTIDSPLDEPPAIRGGFMPYREEATYDRFGDLLLMSSLERMTGPLIEVEKGRPVVTTSFNVSTLPLIDFSEMLDKGAVNDDTLWGMPARCIRLAEVSWERYLYGVCTYFYRVNYSFEIKFDGWNRLVIDQGTRRKLIDSIPLSPTNPFVPYINPATHKPDVCYLDGTGNAVEVELGASLGDVFVWEKELEDEFDFTALGIPTSL
jgi:hypothetical protein